ncbi:hypothetical protein NBO_270g0001 [Nosema bombycis CQ1]|uniref:Uncharacterized protein n=1 Tax=Nosema bombycis (strain CQ1 / CVCC 102059) TaxID=578461 RepID=R0KS08_NOSB1|nr:hypothetical protein NBO_270g0001 [Nosema bombycis CQ1]|eukprot:EOB12992.1 hypothetical protein NBO_270g0001 [Nosema bombycis CQ1]
MEKEIQNLSKNIKESKDNTYFYDLNSLKSLVDKRNELWREEKNLKNELKGIEEELKWRGCSVEGGSKVEKGFENMGVVSTLNPNNPKDTPSLKDTTTLKDYPLHFYKRVSYYWTFLISLKI